MEEWNPIKEFSEPKVSLMEPRRTSFVIAESEPVEHTMQGRKSKLFPSMELPDTMQRKETTLAIYKQNNRWSQWIGSLLSIAISLVGIGFGAACFSNFCVDLDTCKVQSHCQTIGFSGGLFLFLTSVSVFLLTLVYIIRFSFRSNKMELVGFEEIN